MNHQLMMADFADGSIFETYGEITVWIKYREAVRPKKLVLTVHPTDSMKHIAEQINQKLQCTVMEIKSLVLKEKHKLVIG